LLHTLRRYRLAYTDQSATEKEESDEDMGFGLFD
jgi:ribosomal protein L12E/L44/L45/RPP1/RPP2